MKRNVPDERKTKAILELICALDGRIVKVEDDGDGMLVIYANIAHYPDDEELEDDLLDDDILDEDDLYDEDDDYSDVADCYQTCENYRPVSEEDWRCVNYCPHCHSCLSDAA
jgi:hypothetical protein